METIGERMKKIRLQKRLSVSDVAMSAQIPISTYREWENGRQIKGEPYEKIAAALNVSLNELITGKSPKAADVLNKIQILEKVCLELRKDLETILY